MWPDIDKVHLFEEVPMEIKKLSRVMQRLEASRFFAGYNPFVGSIAQVDSTEKCKIRSWLIWASLLAFSAIKDSLDLDLEELNLLDRWKVSQERRDVYNQPLIAVLLELRNYEIHFEFREGEIKNFSALLGYTSKPEEKTQEIDLGEKIFIAQVEFISLFRLRNIKSGQSHVTVEMVNWFNRQASAWPAAYLLGKGREVYSGYIARFLKSNKSDMQS